MPSVRKVGSGALCVKPTSGLLGRAILHKLGHSRDEVVVAGELHLPAATLQVESAPQTASRQMGNWHEGL